MISEKQPFYHIDFDLYSVLELHRGKEFSFDLEWIQTQEVTLKKILESPFVFQSYSVRVIEENKEIRDAIESIKICSDRTEGNLRELLENAIQVGEKRIHFIVKEFLVVRKQDIDNIQMLINNTDFEAILLSEVEAASIRIK
ncbi:hypothetical protein ACFYU8_17685 [Brevibacillus sp. NPDC003359]|uniref:hypothetical protein n=1 Tax=unclassified Brevibacillus TaxID=2684853 RepID=UPI0036798A9C